MVSLKGFGGTSEPDRTQTTGQRELITWKQDEVPATQQESRTSAWYDTFGWIQVTEFISWKEVVDWGLATFSLSDPPSQKLGEKIAEIANWIDATRSSQRGRLSDFYVDDFKQALLLKPGADALVPMQVSPSSAPQVAVAEIFTVKSMTDPVSLLIHTVFKGRSAEILRSAFNNTSHEKMEKAYLNSYAKDYTKIEVESPLRFQDFPDSNRFEVWQDYTISNLWTRDTPTSQWKANFTPYCIVDAIGKTTSAQRTTPYRLDYLCNISEELEIQLFRQWKINTTPVRVDTPNFAFTENAAVDGNTIHLKYHYQTLAADVMPANIEYYNEQTKMVQRHLQRNLTFLSGMELGLLGAYRPNWIGFIIFGLVLGVSGYGAGLIYSIRRSHDHSAIPSSFVRYEGISGWLILVLMGLVGGIFVECKTACFGLDVILPQY